MNEPAVGFKASVEIPPLARGLTWDEMVPGTSYRTSARTVTEADLIQFITWAGFTEPLFFDASSAGAAGYRGRLVPGAMTYCIAEGLIMQTNVLNGTGMAFLGMDLSIKQPVFVGDTLHAIVTTTGARPTTKPHRGIVDAHVSVRNQDDVEVLTFTPTRMIRGSQ